MCAWRGAAALADRLLERIRVHDLAMEAEPWDGPGEAHPWAGSDPHGRAWKLVTLTSPAGDDEEARFKPDALRAAVKRVRGAVRPWWRATRWGRQTRDRGSRRKRGRKDTSLVYALESLLAAWSTSTVSYTGSTFPRMSLPGLGVADWAWTDLLVDVRLVDPSDPTHGIREALKYATKAEGTKQEQAARAAAVEYAFYQVHRVGVTGALRAIQGRSSAPDSEDVRPEDLHDDYDAACEACGTIGSWAWARILPPRVVEANGGWGLIVPTHERTPP